jgi:predicted DNA-binding transcriptional regulator AlpA
VAKEIWYTMTEVTEILGVSRSTVDDWRRGGRCPKFMKLPSGGLRMRASDFAAWVETLELV